MPYFFKTASIGLVFAAVIGGIAVIWPVLDARAEATAANTPPALASDRKYQTNTVKASVPGTVREVRAFFDSNPITDYLMPTDAIPAITGITYLSGDWPEVGAVRQVQLAGGFTVHERVLINRQDQFTYQIWDITAPAGRYIDHIKGEFRYEQNGDTVDVTWDYNIKPGIFVARPFIRRYLNNDFGPFMQGGMQGIVGAYTSR